MKRLKLIAIVFLLGTSFTCEKEKVNQTVTPKTTITPILCGSGELYGNGAEGIVEQNVLITDSVTWNNLKAQMNSVNDVTSSFLQQTVDFSQWMVLASFDQIRGSGGHAIWLSPIEENANTITAVVHHSYPSEAATAVMNQPFTIVKIPVSPKPVIFN